MDYQAGMKFVQLLLQRWPPMTVPHIKSLSSSEQPIQYQKDLQMETELLGVPFYTPAATGSIETHEKNN